MGADGAVVRRRGRRPGLMRRYKVTLSLHPVVDADLIAALDGAPRGGRSALVREWLRSGVRPERDGTDEDDRPDLEDLGGGPVEFLTSEIRSGEFLTSKTGGGDRGLTAALIHAIIWAG